MKYLITLALVASSLTAQVTLNETTTAATMTASQTTAQLASTSNVLTGYLLYIVDTDGQPGELVTVTRVTGNTVTIQRGQGGYQVRHDVSARVIIGPNSSAFGNAPKVGGCAVTDTPFTPWVNVSTGITYTCTSGAWIATNQGGGTTLTLTTTGFSGPATLVGDVLNIPQYTASASGFTVTRTSSTVLNVTAGTVRINGAFFDVAASAPTVVSGSGSVLAYVSADGAMTIAPATGVTVTCASPCVVLPAVTTPAFPANSIGTWSATVASGAWPADGSIIRYAGAVELAAINPGSGMSETNVAGVRTFNVTAATRRMTVPAIDAGVSGSPSAVRSELDGWIITMQTAGTAWYPINQLSGESITSVNVTLDFRINGFGGGSDTLLAAIGCEAVAASQNLYAGVTFGSNVTFTPAVLAFRGYRSGSWTLTLGSACTAPDRPVVRFTRTGTDDFYLGSMSVAVNN